MPEFDKEQLRQLREQQSQTPPASKDATVADFSAMVMRDAQCAPTWFTGPKSATAMAIRDRRDLIEGYSNCRQEIERLTRELRLAESARDYANDMLDKARSGHEVIPIDAQRLRRLEALLAMWLSYAIQGGDVPDVLASNNPVHMLIRDTRNAIRKPASSLGESNSAPETSVLLPGEDIAEALERRGDPLSLRAARHIRIKWNTQEGLEQQLRHGVETLQSVP